VTPTDAGGDAATCAASYTIPLPGPLVEAAFDPASDRAYVAIGRDIPASGSPGDGTGWLGLVDICAGAITKTFDPPLVAGKPATSLRAPLLAGGSIYMMENQPAPSVRSVVRFDLAAQAFTATGIEKVSTNKDELWSLAVPSSGKVWASGTRAFDIGSNLVSSASHTRQLAPRAEERASRDAENSANVRWGTADVLAPSARDERRSFFVSY